MHKINNLTLCVCFVDRCLSFCTFSFGHCVVCSSSINRFWLPPFVIFKIFLNITKNCVKLKNINTITDTIIFRRAFISCTEQVENIHGLLAVDPAVLAELVAAIIYWSVAEQAFWTPSCTALRLKSENNQSTQITYRYLQINTKFVFIFIGVRVTRSVVLYRGGSRIPR